MSGTYLIIGAALSAFGLVLFLTVGKDQKSTAGSVARLVATLCILVGVVIAAANLIMSY